MFFCVVRSKERDENTQAIAKVQADPATTYSLKVFGLNKPKGYITSTKDEKNRPTVYELLPAERKKLIYIGRLDFNSEGLLLFTNNGDFSRLLEIPKSKIIRSYKVKVRGELRKDQEKLSIKGLKIENVIHKFKKSNIDINRKMLSQLAVLDASTFKALINCD